MYKKIQTRLLSQYPLLWNTKFIPMFFVGILLNLGYFGFGYLCGIVDFTGEFDINFDEEILFLIGLFINILVLIIWLIYYFRNNSLSTFYRKSSASIFYEFIHIFVICLFIFIYPISYSLGKEFKLNSYYSKEELLTKSIIISNAAFFINNPNYNTDCTTTEFDSDGKQHVKFCDSIEVFGKKIKYSSLINSRTEDVFQKYNYGEAYRTTLTDSLDTVIKIALINNDKVKIKKIMSDYLRLVSELKLKTNLTVTNWFKLVYDYPNFVNYQLVKPYFKLSEMSFRNNYEEIDTTNYNSKFYVQHNLLVQNFRKLNYDFVSKNDFYDILTAIIFLTSIISSLIFSYRLTNLKSWMTTFIVTGLLEILFLMIAVPLNSLNLFLGLNGLLLIINLLHFSFIMKKKKQKGLTKYSLNYFIWSIVVFLPLIYAFCYNQLHIYSMNISDEFDSIFYFMEDNFFEFSIINVIFLKTTILVLTKTLYNWKGIPEE